MRKWTVLFRPIDNSAGIYINTIVRDNSGTFLSGNEFETYRIVDKVCTVPKLYFSSIEISIGMTCLFLGSRLVIIQAREAHQPVGSLRI
jgi:hypothetical protein